HLHFDMVFTGPLRSPTPPTSCGPARVASSTLERCTSRPTLCRPSPSRGRLPCGGWTSSARCRRRPEASPTCWWQSTNSPNGSRLDPSARLDPSKPFCSLLTLSSGSGSRTRSSPTTAPSSQARNYWHSATATTYAWTDRLWRTHRRTGKWSMPMACPPRAEAKDLQQAEQIWPEVAHRATLGYLEPKDYPKQSHGLY